MFLLNLTLGQLLVVAGSLTALTTLLYLIDRTRRRVQVSTFRFWVEAEKPVVSQRRKRVQQPFSLLLQLLGLLLLLLALAQPRWGSRDALPARHVLLLDTSSGMSARSPGSSGRTLMDDARDRAAAYLQALPAGDEVLLARVDALATPATAFVASRQQLARAIAESRPGATALHLHAALAFAQQVQRLSDRRGEIVYIGPGRIADPEGLPALPQNLRVIPVKDASRNVGLKRVSVKRSRQAEDVWDIFVTLRNYGTAPSPANLLVGFDGAPIGGNRYVIPPESDQQAAFSHRSRSRGVLDVRILNTDDVAEDKRATVEVPGVTAALIDIYSDAPDTLRPFFAGNSRWKAVFHPTAQYNPDSSGLMILDRFRPEIPPRANAVWLDPPAGNTQISIRTRLAAPAAVRWSADRELTQGLRTHDLRLETASVFTPAKGDWVVASIDAGPVIVARDGAHREIFLGFEPATSKLRFELATPLLFANILAWALPDSFRYAEISAQPVGTETVTLDREFAPEEIHAAQEDGSPVPFTVTGRALHFFAGTPGKVRVRTGARESMYWLTLPEIGEAKWTVPPSVRTGIPSGGGEPVRQSRDLWQMLAVLGTACFAIEWVFFGKLNRTLRRTAPIVMDRWRKAS